jgi:hypothetical protein
MDCYILPVPRKPHGIVTKSQAREVINSKSQAYDVTGRILRDFTSINQQITND